MWDGWVDVERPHAYILGHWNYQAGVKKNVYVVSSADRVELFVNGISKGYGEQSSRFLFTFKDIAWQSGTVRAVGYDENSRKLCETEKKTAGKPAAISLTTHMSPDGFRADGSDLALIDVEVVDAEGNRCPTALNMINFDLAGPAEWRGGIAQGPENYILSKNLPLEGGINRIIIRSTRQAGEILISAFAKGLNPSLILFNSRPSLSQNGLSFENPSDGLPSYLERGPTPSGPSFTPIRKSVRISGAVAGSNTEKAALSFDDNENTSWTSERGVKNAWITYEFAQPANVSEVTIKLANWRTRSYPIKISVDDKIVFAGETPRSLGYVTFSFGAVMGRSLKIELTGNAREFDAFGNIVEITGQKDDTATTDKNAARAMLSIVEAEVYAPVAGKKSN